MQTPSVRKEEKKHAEQQSDHSGNTNTADIEAHVCVYVCEGLLMLWLE